MPRSKTLVGVRPFVVQASKPARAGLETCTTIKVETLHPKTQSARRREVPAG